MKTVKDFPCGCRFSWDAGEMLAEPCTEGHRALLEVMMPEN